MKKLILISALVMSLGIASAQQIIRFDDYNDDKPKKEEQKIQTVFNSIEINRISGFGGPTMSYSTIKGEFAYFAGGGGGLIINNMFLGGYGEGLSNNFSFNTDMPLRSIEFKHGGLWLGYEILPKLILHPVISSRIGWGTISGVNKETSRLLKDQVFVVVPTVSAEVNFTRFFKINLGAEYRLTSNINEAIGFTNNDFSNLGVYMNFVFGWF